MKSFAVLALGAGVALAQSLTDLPPCGQTCVTNMINIASSEFGCTLGDVNCYCTNQAFGYGVRDCANESCPSDSDAAAVIAYGTAYCANAIQSAGSSISASASDAASTGALAILSSALSAATTGPSAITTEALVATITSDGSTFVTTTGFSTVYSSLTGSAADAASSVTGSLASRASSATGSLASRASSLTGSLASEASSVTGSLASKASSLASKASSLASSGGAAASSAANSATGGGESSTGGAPQQTAQAILGAAGMAALFLF